MVQSTVKSSTMAGNHFNEPQLRKMLVGSGKRVPMSLLPLWEVETWAWNSANSEATSLSLSLLVLPHPAAMTGLEFSRAPKVLVLLERKLKLCHVDTSFQDIRGHPGVCKNKPTWETSLLSFLKNLLKRTKALSKSRVTSLYFTGPHDNPVRWAGQMLSGSSCLNTWEESDSEKLGDFSLTNWTHAEVYRALSIKPTRYHTIEHWFCKIS